MSRHRNVKYDMDDYYDDDDYYDEYEEEYYEEEEGQWPRQYGDGNGNGSSSEGMSWGSISIDQVTQQLKSSNALAPSPEPPEVVEAADLEAEQVNFIIDALSGHPNAVSGGPSAKRVGQILYAFDNDVAKALSYFEEQLNKIVVTPPQQQPSSAGAGSDGSVWAIRSPAPSIVSGSVGSTVGSTASGTISQAPPPTTPPRDGTSGSDSFRDRAAGLHINAAPTMAGITTPVTSHSRRSRALSVDEYGTRKSKTPGSGSGGGARGAGAPLSPTTPSSASKPFHLPKKSEGLPHVSVVVAGHVDAGKSTLVGQLLHKAGLIARSKVSKFSRDAEAAGKGSFYLAWIMDEGESEREHGVTIGIAERHMTTEHRNVILLDAPGHRDFIPNMISGATHADAAMLVVTAAPGEFESSMSESAQTREHALILKAIGVESIIVAVNKMDRTNPVPWSHERYQHVCAEVLQYLLSLKFTEDKISFLPMSGMTGDNVSDLNPCPAPWYEGTSLLSALDTLEEPRRPVERAVRAVVTAAISNVGIGSDGSNKTFIASVKVLQGRLRRGRGVGLAPTPGVADVQKIIRSDGQDVPILFPGECGDVWLIDRGGRTVEEMALWSGMILFKGPPAVKPCTRFKATLLTTAVLSMPMLPGSTYSLYLHGEELQCRIRKIYSVTYPATQVSPARHVKKPKAVGAGCSALVQIQVERLVCIEPFTQCRMLGRFALRTKGQTCAVGICERIRVKDG